MGCSLLRGESINRSQPRSKRSSSRREVESSSFPVPTTRCSSAPLRPRGIVICDTSSLRCRHVPWRQNLLVIWNIGLAPVNRDAGFKTFLLLPGIADVTERLPVTTMAGKLTNLPDWTDTASRLTARPDRRLGRHARRLERGHQLQQGNLFLSCPQCEDFGWVCKEHPGRP